MSKTRIERSPIPTSGERDARSSGHKVPFAAPTNSRPCCRAQQSHCSVRSSSNETGTSSQRFKASCQKTFKHLWLYSRKDLAQYRFPDVSGVYPKGRMDKYHGSHKCNMYTYIYNIIDNYISTRNVNSEHQGFTTGY